MGSSTSLTRRLRQIASNREAQRIETYLQAVAAELEIDPETLRREAEDLLRRCALAGAIPPKRGSVWWRTNWA